jgi:hypothetical protein
LLLIGHPVNVHSRGPVTLSHYSRRIGYHHEAQAIERDTVEASLFDVEGEANVTMALSRDGGSAPDNAGAKHLAIAVLEVVPLQVPSIVGHVAPLSGPRIHRTYAEFLSYLG